MKTLLIVGLGGVFGSISRYLTSLAFNKYITAHFYLGTFTVNVIGCLLLGLLYGASQYHVTVSEEWRKFIGIGFCGSLTTFSTFSYESTVLIQQGQLLQYGFYLSGSIITGLLFTFLGIYLARFIWL